MPGWRWLHTPGHTPGHVSFWREADRALIAGDAFITTRQESAYAVATQEPEMHGPPMYFTMDWEMARTSVELLAQLKPEIAITGHGQAMQGPAMRAALEELAREFENVAVPKQGEYVDQPARADDELEVGLELDRDDGVIRERHRIRQRSTSQDAVDREGRGGGAQSREGTSRRRRRQRPRQRRQTAQTHRVTSTRRCAEGPIGASEARGYRQMIAVIGDSAHQASIRVHQSAGFTLVGTFRDVGYKFGRWLDTVLMQRPLGPGGAAPPK